MPRKPQTARRPENPTNFANSATVQVSDWNVGGFEGVACPQRGRMELAELLHCMERPIVCSRCAVDVTEGRAGSVSMAEYMRYDVGFTSKGLQVWCRRHEANVVHIDFQGREPPADFRCIQRKQDS